MDATTHHLFNADFLPVTLAELPHFAAAAVVVVTAGFIWSVERGTRLGRLFVSFAVLFALWVAGRGLIHMIEDPQPAAHLSRTLFAISTLSIPLLLRVISIILLREREQQNFVLANWLVAMVLALLAVNTPWFIAGMQRFSWGLEPIFGPAGYAYMVWILALMSIEGLELVQAHRRTLVGSVERRRLNWFAVALGALYFAALEFPSALGLPVYPVGGLGVVAFTLLVAYITVRHGLVQVTAQMAAEEIVDMVRGALLIVDQDGAIRLFSARAAAMLGLQRREVLGRSASLLLGEELRPQTLARLAAQGEHTAETELVYRRPRSSAPSTLALSVAGVRDRKDAEVAYVCVLRDLTEQKRIEREQARERATDALTGLPNRASFLGMLDLAGERCRNQPSYRYAVCFIGLDRMRQVNDLHGYSVGDQVLREVAERLRGGSRPQDAVARVGGDEFAILVRGLGQASEIAAYVDNLRAGLRLPVNLGEQEYTASAHFGFAVNGNGACNGLELLRRAAGAMYAAKQEAGGG